MILIIFFIITVLPIIFFINPIYQRHVLVERKEKKVMEVLAMSKNLPEIIQRNTKKIRNLQEKLQNSVHFQSIEEMLQKHHLQIEFVKPYEGGEKNEVHLTLKGSYHDFLQFLETLSQQANAMELIYISMNKDGMEIVFKSNN